MLLSDKYSEFQTRSGLEQFEKASNTHEVRSTAEDCGNLLVEFVIDGVIVSVSNACPI